MGGICKSHGNEFSTYAELYVSFVEAKNIYHKHSFLVSTPILMKEII